MISFKNLTIRNFMSYGNNTTIINLENPGTTLVRGEDLDNTSSGSGANGVGKFQSVDSLVKVPGGWMRMGDVKVGTVVQTPDGLTSTVTGVFPQGLQKTYRVTFSDGRSTLAGGPHLWTVFSHRWGKQGSRGSRTVTTEDVIELLRESRERNNKPWYNLFVPTVVHPDMLDGEVPIHPYLLGVLLGDGSMSTNVRLTSSDQAIVDACGFILEHETGQRLVRYGVNNVYDWDVVGVSERSIKSKLRELGLMGCTAASKFIPREYLEGTSINQKLELLSGLLDTDGTVSKTKNVSFCSVSKRLAEDVQYLVRSIGGKATITTRAPFYRDVAGNKVPGQVAYNVSIRYANPHNLFKLQRKLERLSSGVTQYANEGLRIVSVEEDVTTECQCIMIDHPDHLYITDDFIVTHNTTMINALAYAVYDKPVSDISKEKLVNNINQKDMEVTVEFTDSFNNEYRIVRNRKVKGSAGGGVYFYKNGDDITLDSIANTNTLIQSVVGIPHEMFVRIVVFSATHTPFLDLPSRAQADMIEGLFGVTEISQRAETLKGIIKDNEARLALKKAVIEQANKEIQRHKQQIISVSRRVDTWDEQTAASIVKMKSQLAKVAAVDVENQRKLHEEAEAVAIRLSACETEISTKKRYLHTNDTRRIKVLEELTHLRDAKCPYCLQHFASGEDKIEALENELDALAEEWTRLMNQSLELGKVRENLVIELTDAREQITVENITELMKIASQSSSIVTQIGELETAVNPHVDTLNELLEMTFDDVSMDEVNALVREIEHQKFLLKLLTKNDSFVRKTLLNRYLPYLNTQLQHYLDWLGLPHKVEFLHNLSARISQFDRELDFGNLSAGQRARVNFALSFAFRDVLERLHTKINVCMLDEVLDVGLDTVGVQAAAKLVKRKARDEELSMFIVSHRDEVDGIFDRAMTVQMSQGFSYIKDNDIA